MRLLVIGDAVLDRDLTGHVSRVCPDAPVPVVETPEERVRPGGAALAATLAAAIGTRWGVNLEVTLLTSLGDDPAGAELRELLDRATVEAVSLRRQGATPEKTRIRAAGQSLVRLDRGERAAPIVENDDVAERVVAAADAVLVADYGAGVTELAGLRRSLGRLSPRTPMVWDPHPCGGSPTSGAWLVTPNELEALRIGAAATTEAPASLEGRRGRMGRVVRAGRHLREEWEARAVAITLGADGAVLVTGAEPPLVVPAQPVVGDACGAGDCLAAAASVALAAGALPSEALRDAVAAASAFVADGGAAAMATPTTRLAEAMPSTLALGRRCSPAPAAEGARPGSLGPALARIGDVRARGGTVVATGGCFDLLHPGHIGVLQAARALGDYLVVCLNSDASVRRLKGPGRPVQREADRAAVLLALSCVDHVVTFDEDTPVELLRRLRPDIFAKGGDYALDLLPEEEALHAWGGQLVILPYLAGRSTTALLDQAGRRGEG